MNKLELKEKAIQLSSQGLSFGKIAEQLEVGKTTVYNWITSVPEREIEKNVPVFAAEVPNSETSSPIMFENEMNDLNQMKHELENEFGTENNINTLVELRKVELEHDHKMERLEMERRTLLHKQKMEAETIKANRLNSELEEMRMNMENANQKSERLESTISEMKHSSDLFSLQLENVVAKNQKKELDEDLLSAYENHITNFLDLEGNDIQLEHVNNNLKEVGETMRQFKKWIKNTDGKKSNYPELITLQKIRSHLSDMINQFEDLGEDVLDFTFDSKFEMELKELY